MKFKQQSTGSKPKASPSPASTHELSLTFEQTRAVISPTAAGKKLEMTAKRASALAKLCALMREQWGGLAPYRLPYASGPKAIDLLCKEVSDPWYESYFLSSLDGWEWSYYYWLNGGHDRNFQALMKQMPDKNREAVRKYRLTLDKYELPRSLNW